MLCLLISAFSLFGCAEQQENIDYDEDYASTMIEIMIDAGEGTSEETLEAMQSYPEYVLDNLLMEEGIPIDGEAYIDAIKSWKAGVEECGAYEGHDDLIFEPSPDGLDVTTTVHYADRDAEVIFSFDKGMYFDLLTVNAEFSTGEILSKAGMNTLIGMGVVFSVLILMSFIIYLFKFIPILQEKITGKKPVEFEEAPEEEKKTVVAAAYAQEETPAATDDTELVAVIAAAIAADEGTSTDGFVVRSIRRRPSNKWNS